MLCTNTGALESQGPRPVPGASTPMSTPSRSLLCPHISHSAQSHRTHMHTHPVLWPNLPAPPPHLPRPSASLPFYSPLPSFPCPPQAAIQGAKPRCGLLVLMVASDRHARAAPLAMRGKQRVQRLHTWENLSWQAYPLSPAKPLTSGCGWGWGGAGPALAEEYGTL